MLGKHHLQGDHVSPCRQTVDKPVGVCGACLTVSTQKLHAVPCKHAVALSALSCHTGALQLLRDNLGLHL